jgi:hypothetical protein
MKMQTHPKLDYRHLAGAILFQRENSDKWEIVGYKEWDEMNEAFNKACEDGEFDGTKIDFIRTMNYSSPHYFRVETE